jgi:hypothetical protein
MSHEEALCILAAERYLLSEFDNRLREAFEEHFFDCSDCAADLRAGATFLDALKHLPSATQTPPH